MTKYYATGITIANSGGLYTVAVDNTEGCPLSGTTVSCTAKGAFRHKDERLRVGDRVRISFTDHSFTAGSDGEVTVSETFADICICELLERKNTFIRPPVSNIDCIFVVLSARSPKTDTLVADKLISITEFNRAEPIIVISKSDLDQSAADELYSIYKKAGFDTFLTSGEDGRGVSELHAKVEQVLSQGKVIAFAGASGVGKSTMINKIFPSFGIATGDVSRKTARGRHTTRAVTLYPIGEEIYLADTPGFSMLDATEEDYATLGAYYDDFVRFADGCKFHPCTHTSEPDCAVKRAVERGEIDEQRYERYLKIFEESKENYKKRRQK